MRRHQTPSSITALSHPARPRVPHHAPFRPIEPRIHGQAPCHEVVILHALTKNVDRIRSSFPVQPSLPRHPNIGRPIVPRARRRTAVLPPGPRYDDPPAFTISFKSDRGARYRRSHVDVRSNSAFSAAPRALRIHCTGRMEANCPLRVAIESQTTVFRSYGTPPHTLAPAALDAGQESPRVGDAMFDAEHRFAPRHARIQSSRNNSIHRSRSWRYRVLLAPAAWFSFLRERYAGTLRALPTTLSAASDQRFAQSSR